MTKREMNEYSDPDFSGLIEEMEQEKREKGETGVRADFRPINSNFGVDIGQYRMDQLEQLKPAYTLPPVFWEEDSQTAMDALNDEITAQILLRLGENVRPTRVLMDQKVYARMGELLKWKYPDVTQEQIEAMRWWHDDILMVHLDMVVCSDAELFVPGAMPTR